MSRRRGLRHRVVTSVSPFFGQRTYGQAPGTTVSAFVRKLPEEQDGDVLREGIRVFSQALHGVEVAGLTVAKCATSA